MLVQASRHGIRRQGIRLRLAAVAVVATVLASIAGDGGVEAASVSAKRREAAQLQAQIESLNDRLSALAEDANQATVELGQTRVRLEAAEVSAKAAAAELDRRRTALFERALRSYATSGNAGGVLDIGHSLDDNVRRQAYLDAARGRDLDAVDALAAAREDLQRRQRSAAAARRDAASEAAAIARAKDRAEGLLTEQEQLLGRTKGELGRLIVEEEKRAAVAEAARVRKELERRKAAARTELGRRRAAAEQLRVSRSRPALTTSGTTKAGRTKAGTNNMTTSTNAGAASAGASSQRQLQVEAGEAAELPPTTGGGKAIAAARDQLGKPYLWGGGGMSSFDCSGLTSYAWSAAGRSLPHSSRAQYAATVRVSVDALRPGDLLFYGQPIHHVGIYVGNGLMVEAPHRGALVRTRSIFRRDYVGAGRVA